MEEITVEVKIDVGDMYNFFMYHTYSKMSGVFSIIFGLGMIGLMILSYGQVPIGQSYLYVLFGIFFIVFNPINFYAKAYKLVKNTPTFQEPIFYTFNKEGIMTKQNTHSATVKWEEVQKVVHSKRSIIIYMSKVRANIIPKQAIGDSYNSLLELIRNNVESVKVKIK
ncbi:MAG: YcxB family protein [Candidatus Galacturonibacter soehngenii]|nr:YcxB family protein [Candidatus Galacturonibacter soehngenii]